MPTLWIDAHCVETPPEATLLQAAAQAGVVIPTLCHLPERPSHQAGCLVCVVEDLDTGRLLPACVARATEATRIATDSPRVREARRQNLALILGDHRADCEAPCQLACPAHLDIPAMMRALAQGDFRQAGATVYERIALPHLLSAVCSAPCEKRCHRRDLDSPLAICVLKGLAAAHGTHPLAPLPATGKRITIVGAGPTGLAAAFFLLRQGHACHLVDDQPDAGGALRSQPVFSGAALERDLAVLRQLGATFAFNTRIDASLTLEALSQTCDALALCCGEAGAAQVAHDFNLPLTHVHLSALDLHPVANRSLPIFAAGAATHRIRMAVIANAQGRLLAERMNAWLKGLTPANAPSRTPFRSHAGSLPPEALASMVNPDCRSPERRDLPDDARPAVIIQEAQRCLQCDCMKADSCRLREICTAAELPDSHARHAVRPVERILTAHGVVIELAKCIACGICVTRSQILQAPIGLAYHGRGYDVRVGPPIGCTWQNLPRELLHDAAAYCPTGAICRTGSGCGLAL